jgi:isocitrate/isopropylmalate dehydrogenase
MYVFDVLVCTQLFSNICTNYKIHAQESLKFVASSQSRNKKKAKLATESLVAN